DSPRFEVASIKQCKEEDFASPDGSRRQEFVVTPGRVVIQCRPLDRIIYFAYAGIGTMDNPLLNIVPPIRTSFAADRVGFIRIRLSLKRRRKGSPIVRS